MFVLSGFAFIAGVVTILSPCILPLLPIILSSSTAGSKRRPFGVVFGFIASFTFFTLFLTSIVKVTGLSADFLRNFAIIVLLGFGVSMLLPQTQVLLEKSFTSLSSKAPQPKRRSGFKGGVLVGISLGLIWTPCVGPILASVISLALTGSVTGTAFLITLAYSIGTGLPMLAIIFGGRQLLQRVPWLLRNTAIIKKVFGVLMILTSIGIFYNIDRSFQTYILDKFPSYGTGLTEIEDNETVRQELEKVDEQTINDENMGQPMDEFIDSEKLIAPDLILGGSWLNSDPLTISELKGKVVLVDFWTYTCINCIRTLPYVQSWQEKYSDKGLVIIGVHAPEFEFEKKSANVQKAIEDFGLTYPVMQDNDFRTWRAYDNHYWPAKYLIDKDGRIRYTHFGEGKYDESEKWIQKLLDEAGQEVNDSINNATYSISALTPELYFGYWRIDYLASPEKLVKDQVITYSSPNSLPQHHFSYEGDWKIARQHAIPGEKSKLILNYEAKNVFLVMRPLEKKATVSVSLDGATVSEKDLGDDLKDGQVIVDTDRLYSIIQSNSSGIHELTLEFPDGGVELYAFTFG
ncbi:cytochrome c biogenesis protein DipZ [Patescibacteria group bacterium]|nr:cytochrome c biogenesis protein DipZ [Patescibacteria group bacterium]